MRDGVKVTEMRERKRQRGIPGIGMMIFTAVILLWPGMVVHGAGMESGAQRAKARYYFLQGSLEAGRENMPQAYEYFKKAYELDPSYDEAAFTYGNQRLFMHTDTLQTTTELLRSLEMMRGYVDRNPRDVYAAQMYGYVSTALDTIEEAIRVYENTYSLMPGETQLLPVLSDAYMRKMDGEKAVETLNQYEAIEGKSKDVSLKKITIRLAMKDTVGAIAEVDDLIKWNPRDHYSLLLKGNLYDIIGERDSVISAYRQAETLAPNSGAVKMNMANYYRTVGDSVMLDNMIYEALLSEDFELEDKLGILGDYLQKLLEGKGDKSRGDHLFEVLKTQYPHEPEVLEMSARYSAAKGNFEEAKEAISYAVDMDPTNEQYWLMLMSFDLTEERYADAVKDYGRAREHYEPSMRMKNLYAMAASMLADAGEGERILLGLLNETDSRLGEEATEEELFEVRKGMDYDGLKWVSSIYCMLGDMNYKNGKADKGFGDYEKSLYFLSDNALALNNFAYFLSEEDRDLEKAKKMSRKALDLSGENATYLDTYAWILYKLGEYQQAMDYIELARELAEKEGDTNEEYELHYEAIKKALEQMEDNN